MCFSIAKLWCFGLHNWVFLLSLICPCMICSKRKICKEKEKKNQNTFNMIASVFLGDVGVIGCTSKVTVPIKQLWLCMSVFNFLISQIDVIWDTYAFLLCFHTQHENSLLLLIHVQVQCDLAITRNTCVNICSLNCLNSFFRINLIRRV